MTLFRESSSGGSEARHKSSPTATSHEAAKASLGEAVRSSSCRAASLSSRLPPPSPLDAARGCKRRPSTAPLSRAVPFPSTMLCGPPPPLPFLPFLPQLASASIGARALPCCSRRLTTATRASREDICCTAARQLVATLAALSSGSCPSARLMAVKVSAASLLAAAKACPRDCSWASRTAERGATSPAHSAATLGSRSRRAPIRDWEEDMIPRSAIANCAHDTARAGDGTSGLWPSFPGGRACVASSTFAAFVTASSASMAAPRP
mmetsp:Transcript_21408/g.59423  ORF Transcript_21408/g.59423 Transcript_21408/m.59423 type:complete len:265 (+) Transcript_21408:1689-2483(+)